MNKMITFSVFCFFLSVPRLHAMQPFEFHEVNSLISAITSEYSPTNTKSFSTQKSGHDELGLSLHNALINDQFDDSISPSILNYLVDIKCRFCGAAHVTVYNVEKKKLIQKERYNAYVERARQLFVQKMAEEKRDLEPQTHPMHAAFYNKVELLNAVMNAVGFLTKKILHRLPYNANVIFLGRTPVLMYHLVRALARFGDDKANSLTLYHVHFSGKPNIDLDKQKNFADVFTPEALDFYIDSYLSSQQFAPTINELYVVDFMSTGSSMESFLKIFAEFWRRRTPATRMPEVIVLNLPFNENNVDIDPNSEAGFSLELRSRAHLEHLLTKEELDCGIDGIDCGFRVGDCTSEALGKYSLLIVGEQLMYSCYQRAGGVHYPHRFWNQNEAWRLNQTINTRGHEQIESVIDLAYIMTLNDPNANNRVTYLNKTRDKLQQEMRQKITADEFKISQKAKNILGKRPEFDETSRPKRRCLEEEYDGIFLNPFPDKPAVDWNLIFNDIGDTAEVVDHA